MDYKSIPIEILKKENFTEDIFLIRIKHREKDLPGEFLMAGLPGIGEAPISICSHAREYVELLIANVGNVTGKLAKLNVKDRIHIRGPLGVGYPMHHLEGNNIILIAGGTGLAPLRSVIEYIQKNRAKYKDVHIFLGFRNPACV